MFTIISFLSLSAQSWETQVTASNQSPNPNNPAEYCSTIPPLQQAQASGVLSSPPPTVMVPVGVLKQPGNEGTTFTKNKMLRALYFSPFARHSVPTTSKYFEFSSAVRFLSAGHDKSCLSHSCRLCNPQSFTVSACYHGVVVSCRHVIFRVPVTGAEEGVVC